jgi:hypothetical protein
MTVVESAPQPDWAICAAILPSPRRSAYPGLSERSMIIIVDGYKCNNPRATIPT